MTTIHFNAAATANDAPHKKEAENVPQTTIEQLLASTKVSTLPLAKGKVIIIDSKLSPGEGFQILMEHNILGAPVYDGTKNTFTGFLDVRDLVDLVVHRNDQGITVPSDNKSQPATATATTTAQPTAVTTAAHLSPATAVAATHLHVAHVTAGPASPVTEACRKYLAELILSGEAQIGAKMTCSYLSRRHPFRSVSPDATLLDVAKTLAAEAHRVPVIDASGKLINIISQSSIVAFLNQHVKSFHAEAAKSVEDWKLGTSPVMSVRDNVRTIDVFRAMSNHHMSGLAVTDASGSFVANTTSTDLKLYLNHPKLGAQLLEEPILDFLSQLRQEDLKTDTRTKVPTLSVQSSAPLSLVIGRLAATKSHKIFVADKSKSYHPHAVISLTDVLRTVLNLKKPASAGAENGSNPSHGSLKPAKH